MAETEDIACLRRGAKTLGEIVDRQCRDVLDATQMHAVIDETGDGDWGAVWERMTELCAKGLEAERAEVKPANVAVACNWPRCHGSPRPCFAWCKCRCHARNAISDRYPPASSAVPAARGAENEGGGDRG